jgi:hypothetical protein
MDIFFVLCVIHGKESTHYKLVVVYAMPQEVIIARTCNNIRCILKSEYTQTVLGREEP